MLNKLKVVRNMGLGWTLYRARYELRKKMGVLEREFPPVMLSDEQFLRICSPHCASRQALVEWWKSNRKPFFFDIRSVRRLEGVLLAVRGSGETELLRSADEICDGVFTYFSRWKVRQDPVNWHQNPITGKEAPSDVHWSRIPDLGGGFGDIKCIWEMSRFPFAYTLVRAYATSGEDRYVQRFWQLFEDWTNANAPECGVNYKCCQEMSLRVMAWVFALYAFCEHPESTDDRIFSILKHIYHHALHMEKHFDFALKSVRNNHTISEAAGLFTVGLLFPFFDRAAEWKEMGRNHLETEGLWQIYPDGSYLQHSMNYQRLVVQDYTWALRLGQLNGVTFGSLLRERLLRCAKFLYDMQDPETGNLPNYGMNDGALIHPLSCCDYRDYRPQLNALYHLLTGNRLYESGLHDENLLWLFGPESFSANTASEPRVTERYDRGGYYVIRGELDHGMIRCATYRHRPAQADMLHFDLWYKGQNVLCDAGTYSYNADPSWMAYFHGTASHNTVMIDRNDQMKKGSRFIWFDWTKSKTITFGNIGNVQVFEGEHYGYRPIIHRRALIRYEGCWIVIDDLFGTFQRNGHHVALSWLFGLEAGVVVFKSSSEEQAVEFSVGGERMAMAVLDRVPSSVRMYNGDEQEHRGWRSLYYGEKIPACQWIREIICKAPIRLVTAIRHPNSGVTFDSERQTIRFGDGRTLRLRPIGEDSIFYQNGEASRT